MGLVVHLTRTFNSFGKSEINKCGLFKLACTLEYNILWLDIAMDDVVLVDVVDGAEHRLREYFDMFERELALGEVVM